MTFTVLEANINQKGKNSKFDVLKLLKTPSMALNRIHGLDVLRSLAIILVFMFHYATNENVNMTFLGQIGWVGVDLFFVLSGYLIGNQIFSPLAKGQNFSLKLFYSRRFLRTLPIYFFVLGLYVLIPFFREAPILPPLWKFITFTQNFGLSDSAFSHAWSLCIEEQFYLILPLAALFVAYKGSLRLGWFTLLAVLLAGIFLRGWIWLHYIQNGGSSKISLYDTLIYFPTFSRMDDLLFGVSIAMLKNFHKEKWIAITAKGNLLLISGLLGCALAFYIFLTNHYGFFPTTLGFPLLAASFTALTIAALSPSSWLHKLRIPGATTLAVWSYAIYLTHKPMTHIVYVIFSGTIIGHSGYILLFIVTLVSLATAFLLHTGIETPFLKLRDKLDVMIQRN